MAFANIVQLTHLLHSLSTNSPFARIHSDARLLDGRDNAAKITLLATIKGDIAAIRARCTAMESLCDSATTEAGG